MPSTKFTNLDFDQIKISIKDYLRANSNFTDFDFEGSNFSVLIDTLAYNTYITAFNSNMVVNESFLDSATLRENVVSLARNIGYVPRSRSAATAVVSFNVETDVDTSTLTLQAGLVCTGTENNTNYVFSIPENITTSVVNGVASFNDIKIYQGTFLQNTFSVNGSLDQRFILNNSFIDTSTLVVNVIPQGQTSGKQYSLVNNIISVKPGSEVYLIQEVQDEKYELLFGDGFFGKKIDNGSTILASYIVTDGKDGNGPANFTYQGRVLSANNATIIPTNTITVTTTSKAANGSDIESIDSVKYFAPRLYSSQYRAVSARDYEAIIQDIYPNTESVSVIGGEEVDPPQYGNVLITIKPRNGDYVSDFDKEQILSKLKQYSLTGINQKLLDLKVLYVEIDSSIYYNTAETSNVENLKTNIISTLNEYSSSNINKFGGRFKYSQVCKVIDNVDNSIVSNITGVIIRRNLVALINQNAQYELCYGNEFHIKSDGFSIKSTGFSISGKNGIFYLTDTPNKDSSGKLTGTGIISVVGDKDAQGNYPVEIKSAGTVDYKKGEIMLNPIIISSTVKSNNVIEVQAYPESNDVIGLNELYLSFSISDSKINMVKDTITSGEKISGVGYKVTSSYLNGELKRV
jgi:hypothetical protein